MEAGISSVQKITHSIEEGYHKQTQLDIIIKRNILSGRRFHGIIET